MPPRNRSTSKPGADAEVDTTAEAEATQEEGGPAAESAGKAPQQLVSQPPAEGTTGAGLRLPGLPGLPGGLDAKRLLWFGGLGALATLGVLEWPVAVAVGAGTVVAGRFARDAVRSETARSARSSPATAGED